MDSLQYVRERLDSCDVSLKTVAAAVGVSHSWLCMFARGEIPEPGYSKIKALAEYFQQTDTQRAA